MDKARWKRASVSGRYWRHGSLLIADPVIPSRQLAKQKWKTEWVARIVSIQGQVQVRRKASQEWETVRLEDRFHAGDMIKVGTNSRAAFVLKNESTLRVDQQSTLVFNEAAEKELPFLIELLTWRGAFFQPGASQPPSGDALCERGGGRDRVRCPRG
jgi:hypothetical protein